MTVLLHGPGRRGRDGLPPFGLFFSELTVISGGFARSQRLVSVAHAGGAARRRSAASCNNSPASCSARRSVARTSDATPCRTACRRWPAAGHAAGVQRLAARVRCCELMRTGGGHHWRKAMSDSMLLMLLVLVPLLAGLLCLAIAIARVVGTAEPAGLRASSPALAFVARRGGPRARHGRSASADSCAPTP